MVAIVRWDLTKYRSGQAWRGLGFVVKDGPRERPPLRPETTSPWRFVIAQGDRCLLRAQIAQDWYCVDVELVGHVASIIPPFTAHQARSIDDSEASTWWSRWAHRFCDELIASEHGPLHAAQWMLRPIRCGTGTSGLADLREMPCDDGERASHAPIGQDATIDWATTLPALVPLRSLSPPDASRVKAWSKHVVDRTLPPVLVWWIGGLCSWVILDGHDRFVASVAAGYFPPIFALHEIKPVEDARKRTDWTDLDEAERYAQLLESQPNHWQAHVGLAKHLARTVVHFEEVSRTTAWQQQPGAAHH